MNSLLTKAIALLLALLFTVSVSADMEEPSGEYAGLGAATRGVPALSVKEGIDLYKPPLLGWVKTIISLPVKYDNPLRIVVQSKGEIQGGYEEKMMAYCASGNIDPSSWCGNLPRVAAYYNRTTATIHFPDHVDMTSVWGITVLMHELTHYVQDITGKNRILCSAQIESEAFRYSLKIADVYPMSDHLKSWLESRIQEYERKGCSGSGNTTSSTKIWCATKHSVRPASSEACKGRGGKLFQTESEARREHERLKAASSTTSKVVWCATAVSAIQTTKDYCKSRNGKVFPTESQAQAEHKRLKNQTATTSTSSKVWCATKYSFWAATKASACGSAKVFASRYQAEAEHKRLKRASSSSSTSSSSLDPCPASGVFDNCFGTYTYDGDKYVGEWKDDKMDGQGTYIWTDGRKYVGKWRDGNKHGQGTYTWPSGNKYVGEWRDGKRWKGIEYSSSGQVAGTYTGGEWCKGCQPESVTTATSSSSKGVWCATAVSAIQTTKDYCKSRNGKVFSTESQAQAEHKRLKAESTASRLEKAWCAHSGGVARIQEVTCKVWEGKAFFTESEARKHYAVSIEGKDWIWCVTDVSVIEMREPSCRSRNGKAFSDKSQAEAEHKRLKAESTISHLKKAYEEIKTENKALRSEVHYLRSVIIMLRKTHHFLKQELEVLKKEALEQNKLVKPARSKVGKYVVTIQMWKDKSGYHYSLMAPGTASYSELTRPHLHARLVKLKSQHGDKLYTAVWFPDDTSLSHAEATSFVHQIHSRYDYYYSLTK